MKSHSKNWFLFQIQIFTDHLTRLKVEPFKDFFSWRLNKPEGSLFQNIFQKLISFPNNNLDLVIKVCHSKFTLKHFFLLLNPLRHISPTILSAKCWEKKFVLTKFLVYDKDLVDQCRNHKEKNEKKNIKALKKSIIFLQNN